MDEIIQRLDRIESLIRQSGVGPEYLDNEGAAAFLGLKPASLDVWRSRGEGPAFIKVGRVVRYSVADLREWLAERRREPLS